MGDKARKSLLIAVSLCMMAFFCQAQKLSFSDPEEVGISTDRLSKVNVLIDQAIENKDFPGAVLLVARAGKIVLHNAYGDCQWIPEKRAMRSDMLFDLASITKPVATATSLMILVEEGKLRLWDKVSTYVPEFSVFKDKEGKPGEGARLWHLLTHTSGLPPYTDASEAADLYSRPCPLDALTKHIAALDKLSPPGEDFRYSCLGFITIAYIIEQISGQNISEFSKSRIFKPLGMENTYFNPPKELRDLCVPTEVLEGAPLIGTVHDPLARLLGGISGNAGLFSTAEDLFIFAQMMLKKGKLNGVRILSPLSVEKMTSVYPRVQHSGRGLGWDLDSSYSTNGGDLFGENSYGHTGYTGTSIWIDPDTETIVIFLTNRVHPEDKGAIISMRSKVANVVAGSILK
jgi:CubicO group peptidase (beta-lactamase class C family)